MSLRPCTLLENVNFKPNSYWDIVLSYSHSFWLHFEIYIKHILFNHLNKFTINKIKFHPIFFSLNNKYPVSLWNTTHYTMTLMTIFLWCCNGKTKAKNVTEFNNVFIMLHRLGFPYTLMTIKIRINVTESFQTSLLLDISHDNHRSDGSDKHLPWRVPHISLSGCSSATPSVWHIWAGLCAEGCVWVVSAQLCAGTVWSSDRVPTHTNTQTDSVSGNSVWEKFTFQKS